MFSIGFFCSKINESGQLLVDGVYKVLTLKPKDRIKRIKRIKKGDGN